MHYFIMINTPYQVRMKAFKNKKMSYSRETKTKEEQEVY